MRELCYRIFSSVFSFCKKKGYYWWKYKFYRLSIWDPACGLLRSDRKLKKCQWRHNVPTWCHRQISLEFFLFFLSNLGTGSSFMSISSLVLELSQFPWPEIRKLEIPPSEFGPISGDWGYLRIQNLAQMSIIKCYWILQNARFTAFFISDLARENQQGGIRVKGSPRQKKFVIPCERTVLLALLRTITRTILLIG